MEIDDQRHILRRILRGVQPIIQGRAVRIRPALFGHGALGQGCFRIRSGGLFPVSGTARQQQDRRQKSQQFLHDDLLLNKDSLILAQGPDIGNTAKLPFFPVAFMPRTW